MRTLGHYWDNIKKCKDPFFKGGQEDAIFPRKENQIDIPYIEYLLCIKQRYSVRVKELETIANLNLKTNNLGRGVLETTNEEIKKFVAINFLISGDFLATRPKIKPDGKSYYVRGDVAKVFKNDTMLLEISEHTFGFYGNINKKTSYMFVTMPKKMWTIFENKASIGSEVSLVGRYVSNEDSSGKLVPVLVGEIIAFWKLCLNKLSPTTLHVTAENMRNSPITDILVTPPPSIWTTIRTLFLTA